MQQFDLAKDTAKVKFMLEKKNVPSITAEVVAIIDASGSTSDLYWHGTMQEALQRIVPVALNFDDNGDIPVYVFDDAYARTADDLTAKNYDTFVKKQVLETNLKLWGATVYEGVLRQALVDLGFYSAGTTHPASGGFFKKLLSSAVTEGAGFKPESKSGLPAIIYFITDGENSDPDATEHLLEAAAAANSNVYFNFIGVGKASFRFLQKIGDAYPNTGFAQIRDIEKAAGSDDIYEYLLPDELTGWLKAGRTVPATR